MRVRTVGGLEPWTGTIPLVPTDQMETIGHVLSNRDQSTFAHGGQDYEILDHLITFRVKKTVFFILIWIYYLIVYFTLLFASSFELTINLQEGQQDKEVVLYVLDDADAEGEEEIYVYIDSTTDGVRVAQPHLDNGLKVGGTWQTRVIQMDSL